MQMHIYVTLSKKGQSEIHLNNKRSQQRAHIQCSGHFRHCQGEVYHAVQDVARSSKKERSIVVD